MNNAQFKKLLLSRLALIDKVLASKGQEYASNDEDRLINFKRSGEMKRETPEKALQGMMQKQLTSVYDIIDYIEKENQKVGLIFIARPPFITRKKIDEKIGDSINYLILLEALIKERYGWI